MFAGTQSGERTMGTGPWIVDLSDEDDDDDLVLLTEFPAHLSHRASRKKQGETTASLLKSDLVILEEVGSNPELVFGAGLQKESQKSSQDSNSLADEDDCCILDEDPSKVGMMNSIRVDNEDDLVITGEVGQVACRDYPHARHLCVQFPFKTAPHQLFCSQCHCYVCDMLAPCSLWGDGSRAGDHCHASEKIGERWKLLRQYNKTHPTGCSDPSALQHLLCPGKSLAGNSESASLRELLGCQPGDSARSQHPQQGDSTRSQHPLQRCDPTRPKYPLQISLNGPNRDPRSHPRRHHTQGIGVRAAKFHRYVQRNDLHYTDKFRSYHPEGCGAYQSRRTSHKNGSLSSPQSFSNPGLSQRSHSVYSAVLPRRSTPTATTVEQESFGCMVTNGDTVSKNDYLGELATSNAFLASFSPDHSKDLRQQCLSTETPASNPGSSVLRSQNEVGAYNSQGDGTIVSCSSNFAEAQLSGGSFIERMTEGTIDSLPTSSPTLLADYLLNGDDFWNDLPENFVKPGI